MANTKHILITGPPASGKTERLIDHLCSRIHARGGDGILVLTSVVEERDRLYRRLCERRGGVLGPVFATFEQLAERLLRPEFLKPPLGAVRRRLVWDEVVEAIRPRLKVLRASSHHPDFVARLDSIIKTFEDAVLAPKDLASQTGVLRDLSLLWDCFQERTSEFQPPAARLKLFLERTEARAETSFRFLAVSGFADLSPLRQRVIQALAEDCGESVMTLPDGGGDLAWNESRRSIAFFCEKGWRREKTVDDPAADCPGRALLQKNHEVFKETKGIRIIEGANPLDEIQRAVLAIKHSVRTGVCWEECALLFRDLKASRAMVEAVLRREKIPYSLRGSRPIRESLVYDAAVSVLSLIFSMWERAEVFRLLKMGLGSPPLDLDTIVLLEAEAACERIVRRLDRFLAEKKITSLDLIKKKRTIGAAELFSLLEELKIDRLRGNDPFETKVWERLTAVAEAAPSVRGKELFALFTRLGREMSVRTDCRGRAGVWVSSYQEARGERFDCVVLPQMNEGLFPSGGGGEGFVDENDLRRLDSALAEKDQRDGRERAFAWTAFTRAKKEIVLSFSRANQKGDPFAPSSFLVDFKKLVGEETFKELLHTAPLTHLSTPNEAAGAENLIPTIVWEACRPRQNPLEKKENSFLRALACNLGIESALREQEHFKREDLVLSGEERSLLNEPKVMSPSRLDAYIACPYRYFCESVLHLEPWPKALDALARGRIAHESLYRFFAQNTELNPNKKEEYLSSYRKNLESLLTQEGLERLSLFQQREILDQMTAVFRIHLDQELERNTEWRPSQLEVSFGQGESSAPPLEIKSPDGKDNLKIKGRIDRIDVNKNGEAVVIDYKQTAGSERKREMKELQSLQLPLYLLAAREVLGLKTSGAAFLSIQNAKDRKPGQGRGYAPGYPGLGNESSFFWKDAAEMDEHLARVKEKALEVKASLRAGDFHRNPDTCAKKGHCAFPHLCRLNSVEESGNEGSES